MLKIAVVGSREHPKPSVARDFVDTLYARYGRDFILISGGATGIDRASENRAMQLGLHTISFRPFKISPEEYGVVEWQLNPPDGNSYTDLLAGPHPTFANFISAVTYRDMLIAEAADQMMAFRYKHSGGTTMTCEFFEREGKTPYINDYEEEDHEPLA